MIVKLPVNITKTEISVYLCNDTNFRQKPPGLIFAKLNTYYKFQGKQSTFSKDSFFTRRRKWCKQSSTTFTSNTLLLLGFRGAKCMNSYLNVFLLSMIKCTKWHKANKYKKILHHPALTYSCPEKDNIGMLPTIEIFFARSLTWAVNSIFVTCHVTRYQTIKVCLT